MRCTRLRTFVVLAAAALALTACPAEEPDDPDPPVDDPADPDPTANPDPTVTPDPDPTVTADPDPTPEPPPDEGVDPLTEQRALNESTEEGAGGMLTVTDVRVGTHEGFDRVVFEIAGEGSAGWLVHYVDEPRAQGRGNVVDIEGDAFLEVIVRGVAMPFDAPEQEPWDGERLAGPAGASVLEIVEDTIFEGQHVFHIGLPGQAPFGVVRLDDPQRIVVEIDHGAPG